ncbi:Fic family protein [Kribbella sp. NPDC051936]|uniref:Fic/DOC family protein n=1 Tax=Kribbella sp. NPDC051936 TaxID=3154946 RepID=UPI0034182F04
MATDPYVYPPPHQETLRNKFGELDRDTLKGLEYAAAAERQRQLESGEADIPRTYDGRHVEAIHAHLFQDVYDWAGQRRTVELAKSGPGGFAPIGQIDRYLADAAKLIESADWASMDLDEFAAKAAEVHAYVNQAHPQREGNGRAAKVFMQHVSELSPYQLDFTKVPPAVWNQRSMLTDPDLGKYEPVPDMMVPVFKAIAEPRPGGPSATLLPADLKEARRVAGLDPNGASARTTKQQDAGKAGRQSASRGRPGRTVERD